MFSNWKKACIFAVLLAAAANVSAQTNLNNIEGEVVKVLLKTDLRQAVKEAEAASANDLRSLLWRLSLYRRAAHDEKVASTVRQIIALSDPEKTQYTALEHVLYAIKDPLFKDTRTLRLYLQFDFNDDVYGKFVELCSQNSDQCDVSGFDNWLAQKALENSEAKENGGYYFRVDPYWMWVSRRISWREKFGLDNSGITNQLVEDVRKKPADLNAAMRYLRFFRGIQQISWLADTFASEQAYDYYELGENLSIQPTYWRISEDERRQIHRIASQFLQKSLRLAFNEKDKTLMWERRLGFTSVPPIIKNHEKQLRFWTKTELAAAYTKMGQPQDAQPIVEELMSMDTSDIAAYKPSHLAGTVQAGSGARVVESKILTEQATRQNSYEYWEERIRYYQGRKEPDRVFDAYLQAFAVVPFNLSDRNSRETRLFYVRWFADFTEPFEYYGSKTNTADLNDKQKVERRFWIEAENFFRDEFEKTKANAEYSYKLAEIIADGDFDKLTDDILTQNPALLVNAARIDLVRDIDTLLYRFFDGEKIPRETKESVFARLLKIAGDKDAQQAWIICDAVSGFNPPNYAMRLVPILEKNLKIAANRLKRASTSSDDYQDIRDLKDKYVSLLFDAYLLANNWRSAEKLVMESDSRFYNPFDALAMIAAKNGAFSDAVRYWKKKANLNRLYLENLGSLANIPAVADDLRSFYRQMKVDEPHSPVPDMALNILK